MKKLNNQNNSTLTETETKILNLRFNSPSSNDWTVIRTLSEISSLTGFTREKIRQILLKITNK